MQLHSGTLAALMTLRGQIIPDISAQLDAAAGGLRDQVNAVHNSGSSYPGANSLMGRRLVNAADFNQWSGKTRIAVLDSNGQPVASHYPDEPYGKQPFTLDLSMLNTGRGAGNLSVQGIINTINQYYGIPQNKVKLGSLNNIQLASLSASLPNMSNQLVFDFNLTNISARPAHFFVSDVSVKDNLGAAMSTTSTIQNIALDPVNTYVTSAGSNVVTITTVDAQSFANGQTVFLSTPPAPVSGVYGGIHSAYLGGYFTISNVMPNSFQISVDTEATHGGIHSVAGQTVASPYAMVPAGGNRRTYGNGVFVADISASPAAMFYTVIVTAGVDDGTGAVKIAQISYQVNNHQPTTLGMLVGAQSANGEGTVVAPTRLAPLAVVRLVDASGVELPKENGHYITSQNGYLLIQAENTNHNVVIDSLGSQEQESKRGFSHYFELNNFFSGGNAGNLAVEDRLQDNYGLLSLGQLSQGNASMQADAQPNYTYQLKPGDNRTVQKLAGIAEHPMDFGATTRTLSGFVGGVIEGVNSAANTAATNNTNAQALLASYRQQSASAAGIDLDGELANTVIYQNAYTASARAIHVTNQLFNNFFAKTLENIT